MGAPSLGGPAPPGGTRAWGGLGASPARGRLEARMRKACRLGSVLTDGKGRLGEESEDARVVSGPLGDETDEERELGRGRGGDSRFLGALPTADPGTCALASLPHCSSRR